MLAMFCFFGHLIEKVKKEGTSSIAVPKACAMSKSLQYVKFIYSEKATKFCKISTLIFADVVPVKMVWPSQNI